MTTLTIPVYDGNNCIRRSFETGQPIGNLIPWQSPLPRFWVFDAAGAKATRKKIYPDYKKKRDTETPEINGAFAFIDKVRTELLPHCQNVILVMADGYEADDIIADIVGKRAPDIRYHINSNDGDFWALKDHDIDLDKKPKWAPDVLPVHTRLYKTLLGDSSDSIPGLRGFGPAAWARLTADQRHKLTSWFAGGCQQVLDPEAWGKLGEQLWFNKDQLLIFWQIVGFLPVDSSQHMVESKPDYEKYVATMRKYLWTRV